MKREVFFAVIFTILISSVLAITGEAMTGKVSQAPTNVSVFVQPGPPVIRIFSPENVTYYSTNILLNYSIRDGLNQSKYNLDNSSNISLSNLTDNFLFFTGTLGKHTLYFYANNTYGTSVKMINFTVSNQELPPSSSSSSSSSGSSGGGGGVIITDSFTVDKKILEVSLMQGEGKTEMVKITNTGNKVMNLNLNIEELKDYTILSEASIKLNPGESKDIAVNFFSLGKTPSRIYVGKLFVQSGLMKKEILLVLNVKQRDVLFDVSLKVLSNYKESSAGDKISVLIDMTNIGFGGTDVDVDLILSVMDFDKKILYESFRETLAVKSELSVTRKLQLPKDIPEGTYIAVAELIYQNITASSYDTFDVKKMRYNYNWFLIITLSILVAIIIALIITIKVLNKHKGKTKIKKRR